MNFSSIKSPLDIKDYSNENLKELAAFCRGLILKRTSEFGGHVSPNLGTVEATIALCKTFDLPKDKIVWDVSHQDFTFKMLTGRMNAFTTPLSWQEAGEYTDPKESPEYDMFYAGHTSPSITLSLGLAKARDLKHEDYNIIAFIGDGSLSGGVAYEGLIQAAELNSQFLVVVNDNQMSIPPTEGGIFKNLRQLRESNGQAADNFFRAIGYEYLYVGEGNDIECLSRAFEEAKRCKRPIVVHINTQKGEGYAPAEADREKFHYSGPFVISTGEAKENNDEIDISTLTRNYLLDKIMHTPEMLLITTSTPESFGFYEKEREMAGKQYLDLCIAEQAGVSVTSGAAKGGIRPVYPVISSFLQRAYDQLHQDLALDNLPGVIIVLCGGAYGIPDATHLGFWDIPMLTSIPNLLYLAPSGFNEYRAMLDWAIAQKDMPVAVRAPYGPCEDATASPDEDYSHLSFQSIREGQDVAIIAAGDFFKLGRETADKLEESGIYATLVNPRFVSSIDESYLSSLIRSHKLVMTLEDGSIEGGFGQRIAAFYGDKNMKVIVRGLPKQVFDRYNPAELLDELGLTPEKLAAQIIDSLK